MIQTLHEVEFELTEDQIADYARVLINRDIYGGWKQTLPVALAAILLATWIVVLGLQGWIAPLVAGGLLLVIAFPVGVHLVRRRSMYRIALWATTLAFRGADRTVRVRFTDDRIQMETGMAETGATWRELDEVIIFPGFWLLRCRPEGQFVLPSAAVSAELEALIRGKADEIGALVRHG